MIALFFEVLPKPGQEGAYFEMAAALKPELDASGGLLFLDRSRSEARPGWFLSHQFWRDEASMARWRVNPAHHHAQACGRTDVLADYRLRVAQVVASVAGGHAIMHEALAGAAAYNDPHVVPERFIISILASAPLNGMPGETFASVYDPALTVQVVPVESAEAGHSILAHVAVKPALKIARLCLISRDYTMANRREAPQFFQPVAIG
ncbi:MAG: antibiotic biosynthesis monooxygenase [Hyphomicrobiaceae bacterium]